MCILGKDVYITSTCNGFINRDMLEQELGASFEGKLVGIKNLEHPYEISFNNGASILNLDTEHFEFIEKDKTVEEIKKNIRYVLLTKDRTKMYLKEGLNESGDYIKTNRTNTERNRSINKSETFLTYKEACDFIEKNYLKKELVIESYYIKDFEIDSPVKGC